MGGGIRLLVLSIADERFTGSAFRGGLLLKSGNEGGPVPNRATTGHHILGIWRKYRSPDTWSRPRCAGGDRMRELSAA